MIELPTTQPVPLTQLENGSIRIAGTRVSLDSVIWQHKQGKTPEAILNSFPTLNLRDIYATIAYYLTHTAEVEAYLQAQEERAAELRRTIESDPALAEAKKRVRERIERHRSNGPPPEQG